QRLRFAYNSEADKGGVGEPEYALRNLGIGFLPRGGLLHTGGAADFLGRAVVGASASDAFAVKPPAPFNSVANNVVDAPAIRLFFGNRVRFLLRIVCIPGVAVELTLIAQPACTARILPLSLGGKAVGMACFGREPVGIFHCDAVGHRKGGIPFMAEASIR